MGTAPAAAATKKRRKQEEKQLLPKKSVHKTKTKDNKKKSGNNKFKTNERKNENETAPAKREDNVGQLVTSSQQLSYFINQYQSSNRVQLSSLELESLKETCMVELSQVPGQNITGNLDEYAKVAFGSSWREVLCGKHLKEGQLDAGSPALLVISSSALRSLELLRELRSLTKECHAAKLFSKHMKVEEQVSILKNRVNIASGTPSRIKKLIDMEALGLSRLAVIVLDVQTDVKGYSLFTLPQVREEFWDLYRSYFHQPLLKGDLRICLYGSVSTNSKAKKKTGDAKS